MSKPTQAHNPFFDMVDEILRVSGRIHLLFADVIAASGLSSLESTVLSAIVESQVPPTVPQIGRSLGHPRQVIQRTVNSLLAAGYIETRDNPDHARARLLVATSKGIEVKGEIDARASEVVGRLLREIKPELCVEITKDLHELRLASERQLKMAKS